MSIDKRTMNEIIKKSGENMVALKKVGFTPKQVGIITGRIYDDLIEYHTLLL